MNISDSGYSIITILPKRLCTNFEMIEVPKKMTNRWRWLSASAEYQRHLFVIHLKIRNKNKLCVVAILCVRLQVYTFTLSGVLLVVMRWWAEWDVTDECVCERIAKLIFVLDYTRYRLRLWVRAISIMRSFHFYREDEYALENEMIMFSWDNIYSLTVQNYLNSIGQWSFFSIEQMFCFTDESCLLSKRTVP